MRGFVAFVDDAKANLRWLLAAHPGCDPADAVRWTLVMLEACFEPEDADRCRGAVALARAALQAEVR